MPHRVLDEQRLQRVADAHGVRHRRGVVVDGEHGVAQPDQRGLAAGEQPAHAARADRDKAPCLHQPQRLVEGPDRHPAQRAQLVLGAQAGAGLGAGRELGELLGRLFRARHRRWRARWLPVAAAERRCLKGHGFLPASVSCRWVMRSCASNTKSPC